MSTKHFLHDADTLVLDSLESLTITNPMLSYDRANKAIFLSDHDSSTQVALISGGGAGHEPAHAAYIVEGLLTAAVSGSIFASPNVSEVVNTIARVGGAAGIILIIKNYTGDIFHFHLAAEKARAQYGLKVEIIVVGDDVSVGRQKSGKVGRRGLAGTVLVHKVLGAMRRKPGVSLETLASMGRLVASNLVTVGASLGHVHIPGREIANSTSTPEVVQLELGMGIHNESGCRIIKPPPDLSSLVDMMLDQLLDPCDLDRAFVDFKGTEEIVLLVNNLGSVSVLEMGAITKHVATALNSRGMKLSRVFSGTFMTSLDGPGFSITLLRATEEMIQYIDAPTKAIGWSVPSFTPPMWEEKASRVFLSPNTAEIEECAAKEGMKMNTSAFKTRVSQACRNLIAAESRITHFDTVVRDGDCGMTLARGAHAVLSFLGTPEMSPDSSVTVLRLATVIEENMDGTSGAIYSIFLAALASALQNIAPAIQGYDQKGWGMAAKAALGQLQLATPARKGDRTLMDTLEPFIDSLSEGDEVEFALARAKSGCRGNQRYEGFIW